MTAAPPLSEIGSFQSQTPWECGIYSFGKADKPGVDYFNPGLVTREDGQWLITRRSTWNAARTHGKNDLMAFRLVHNKPQFGVPINLGKRFDNEHFEDPRAILIGGKTFVSCCNFYWNIKSWSGAHQIICEVDENWRLVKRYDPVYGYNGFNLGQNTGHEKNWIYFLCHGKVFMVYQANPHTVIEFDSHFKVRGGAYETNWHNPWRYGEIRGGTPPVLVGDHYYTFFHSSIPFRKPKRQYMLGCYRFDARPPFRVNAITPEPLLVGSVKDPWNEMKPPAVFACGSGLIGDKWQVVFGVNDLKSGYCFIPHEDLLDRMIDV